MDPNQNNLNNDQQPNPELVVPHEEDEQGQQAPTLNTNSGAQPPQNQPAFNDVQQPPSLNTPPQAPQPMQQAPVSPEPQQAAQSPLGPQARTFQNQPGAQDMPPTQQPEVVTPTNPQQPQQPINNFNNGMQSQPPQPAPQTGTFGATAQQIASSQNQQQAAPQSGSSIIGILALVLSFIPLLSIVLGLVSIQKGSVNQNGKLKIMGIVAIILNIAFTVALGFLLAPRIAGLFGANYSSTQEVALAESGQTITMPAPLQKVDENDPRMRDYVQTLEQQDNQEGTIIDQGAYAKFKDGSDEYIEAMALYVVVDMSEIRRFLEAGNDLARTYGQEDAIISDAEFITEVRSEFSSQIGDFAREFAADESENLRVTDTYNIGPEADGASFEFSGYSAEDESIKIKGKLGMYLHDNYALTIVMSAAEESIWDDNQESFQSLFSSLNAVNRSSGNQEVTALPVQRR